jgi:predicted DNA repair protein MutK
MLVKIHQTTRRHIPDDSNLQSHRHENFKSASDTSLTLSKDIDLITLETMIRRGLFTKVLTK